MADRETRPQLVVGAGSKIDEGKLPQTPPPQECEADAAELALTEAEVAAEAFVRAEVESEARRQDEDLAKKLEVAEIALRWEEEEMRRQCEERIQEFRRQELGKVRAANEELRRHALAVVAERAQREARRQVEEAQWRFKNLWPSAPDEDFFVDAAPASPPTGSMSEALDRIRPGDAAEAKLFRVVLPRDGLAFAKAKASAPPTARQVKLENLSDRHLAIKVRSNADDYLVQPATATLAPFTVQTVGLILHKASTPEAHHKFLVQATPCSQKGLEAGDWLKLSKGQVQEHVLGIAVEKTEEVPQLVQVQRQSRLLITKTAAGKGTGAISLTNLTGEEVAVKVFPEAPELFTVQPSQVVLAAQDMQELQVTADGKAKSGSALRVMAIPTSAAAWTRNGGAWQGLPKAAVQQETVLTPAIRAVSSKSLTEALDRLKSGGAEEPAKVEPAVVKKVKRMPSSSMTEGLDRLRREAEATHVLYTAPKDGSDALIVVDPPELRFVGSEAKPRATLEVYNNSDDQVAFKLETTCSEACYVRPKIGTLGPREAQDVQVMVDTKASTASHRLRIVAATRSGTLSRGQSRSKESPQAVLVNCVVEAAATAVVAGEDGGPLKPPMDKQIISMDADDLEPEFYGA